MRKHLAVSDSRLQLIALVAFVGFAWFVLSAAIADYVGVDLMEHLSFRVLDATCESSQGLGVHCFGDFLTVWDQSVAVDPYDGTTLIASNTPLTILVFRHLFSPLAYNFALLCYISASLILTAWSSISLSRALNVSRFHSAVLCVISITSVGFVVSVDRGNHVWMIFPLLAWAISADAREKTFHTIAALAMIAALKFWGGVFLLVFLVRRQWSRFFVTCGMVGIGYAVPFMFVSKLPFIERFEGFFRGILNEEVSRTVFESSISVFAFALKARCEFWVSNCSSSTLSDQRIAFQPLAVAFGIALIGLSVWSAYRVRTTLAVWLPFLVLPMSALPDAGTYNLVLLPIGSILAATLGAGLHTVRRFSLCFLVVAVFLSLPLALDFSLLAVLRESWSLSLPWKIQHITSPLLLGLLTVVTPFLLYNRRQLAESNVSGIPKNLKISVFKTAKFQSG